MKKLDLGQMISIVANVGVIAGIAFLAIELNQNNQLLEAGARYNLRAQRMAMSNEGRDPWILDALHRYAAGADVTPVERSAILIFTLNQLEMWEWQFGEYEAGMLEEDQLPVQAWRLWYSGESEVPLPLKEVWDRRVRTLNPAFVQYMEDNVIGR